MKGYSASGILSAVVKGRGGVSVSHSKNTQDCKIVRMPPPEKVVLPMQQHIGAPCEPLVKVGDEVKVGQIIADTDKFVSTPIHSSVSGKVTAIGEVKLANGSISKAVTIESDGEMTLFDGFTPPKIETAADLTKAVRESGLVGLGGAGFPTHVKLALMPNENIDTLIINAAECEPYITVDYRECIENSDNVIKGVMTMIKYLGFKQAIIAVEDNKPKAIDLLKQKVNELAGENSNIKIMALKSKYPQGAEKMMVQSATGRKIPPGKLPSDVGCVLINVASVAFIQRYIETGKPLVSRSVTVDGSAIHTPKNVRVPIGTSISDIIEYCGGFKAEPFKILSGGPMMGAAIIGTDLPLLKQNNAILAFAEGTFKVKPERDCIRCGRCAQVCPMSLMPTLIARYAKSKEADKLTDSGVMVCMECGSCAYVCPAGLPLVQHMRLAKSVIREAGAKK
ncbi:MAG: electron transport complex subunit RsxC [Clostridia bacterium]|nr:electron transport complex subunit RsxC [Clostridia bacterium]